MDMTAIVLIFVALAFGALVGWFVGSRPAADWRSRHGERETECKALLEKGDRGERHELALPAYDQCIKASHRFNLLDARGVISVTERQSYILRVRELAKACGAAWLKTDGGGAA